jgi:hypothetical protein
LSARWFSLPIGPYALLVIVPTNNTLMATDPAQASLETRQLIRKWASLHADRTALGLAATPIFISASLRSIEF